MSWLACIAAWQIASVLLVWASGHVFLHMVLSSWSIRNAWRVNLMYNAQVYECDHTSLLFNIRSTLAVGAIWSNAGTYAGWLKGSEKTTTHRIILVASSYDDHCSDIIFWSRRIRTQTTLGPLSNQLVAIGAHGETAVVLCRSVDRQAKAKSMWCDKSAVAKRCQTIFGVVHMLSRDKLQLPVEVLAWKYSAQSIFVVVVTFVTGRVFVSCVYMPNPRSMIIMWHVL